MAGHSKWANIKHRKERMDKKRAKIWSKCSRAIMAAARTGGPDPATNLSLRYAIDEARYANMPKDTIQRAIDKGAGAGGGEAFEQVTYEGYGPGGVAVMVDGLTDNRTRTVNDLRTIFSKNGGNMGNAGCVGYMFESKGRILVPASSIDEETIMERAAEAGAEDVEAPDGAGEDAFWTVLTDPTSFHQVKESLEGAGVRIEEAEVARIPTNTVELRGQEARTLMGLIEALEDNDDVQKVSTNAEIPDDEMAAMEG